MWGRILSDGIGIVNGEYQMDDAAYTALGVKYAWQYDSVRLLNEVKPRQIGRVCGFELFSTDDPDNYTSRQVLGTLEAIVGDDVLVSGDYYPWSRIANMKVYRKEIAK